MDFEKLLDTIFSLFDIIGNVTCKEAGHAIKQTLFKRIFLIIIENDTSKHRHHVRRFRPQRETSFARLRNCTFPTKVASSLSKC
jgi:hypothetical protein